MQSKSSLRLPVIVTAILLAGCALIPDIGKPQPILTPQEIASERSFADGRSEWPAADWWRNYRDPQLTRLIETGLANAPSLREAAARIGQAEGLARQAGAPLYPQIEVNGALQKVRQSYNNGVPSDFVPQGYQETARATVDLNFQLDFFGRNRNALAAALSDADAARLDAEQSALMLSTSIAAAYADLVRLYAGLDAANDALRVRSQTSRLFKDRLDNGLENQGSFEQQSANESSVGADIESLKESIALTANRLAALTGSGPDNGLAIDRPRGPAVSAQGLPKSLPAELIGRRPDIMAAKYRAIAAAKRVRAAKAAFYPNVNLTAYIGHQALGLNLFTDSGSQIGAFGPAVTLPIFEGGLLAGRYQQAGAEYDLAVAQYNATLVRALNEVADAATSQRALVLRQKKIASAVAASERAHRVALDRYKGGLSTYLDVLRAEDALIANRRIAAEIDTRSFILDIDMVRALGGGFQYDSVKKKD